MKTKDFLILATVTKEDMQAKLDRLPCPLRVCGVDVPKDLNHLTIGEIIRLQGIRDEMEAITVPFEVVLGVDEKKVMEYEAADVFGFIMWVSREMERINRLFESTHVPPTREEKEAGVEQLNFGGFGVLDWYARRMGITDHEIAGYTPWPRVYKCLDMDSKRNAYERRLREVYHNNVKK